MEALTFVHHYNVRLRHRAPWGSDKTNHTQRHTLTVKIQRFMMIVRSADPIVVRRRPLLHLRSVRDGAGNITF